jgi:hypothetical protein
LWVYSRNSFYRYSKLQWRATQKTLTFVAVLIRPETFANSSKSQTSGLGLLAFWLLRRAFANHWSFADDEMHWAVYAFACRFRGKRLRIWRWLQRLVIELFIILWSVSIMVPLTWMFFNFRKWLSIKSPWSIARSAISLEITLGKKALFIFIRAICNSRKIERNANCRV